MTLLTLTFLSCSGEPIAPSPIVPNFAGTWSGRATIDRFCIFVFTGNPPIDCETFQAQPVAMTLSQDGTDVTGTIVVGSSTGNTSGTVSGGVLVMRPYTYIQQLDARVTVTWSFSEWNLRIFTFGGDVLNGDVRLDLDYENGGGNLTYRLSDLRR